MKAVAAEPSSRAVAQEKRRRRILATATELFEAHGFEGTTTDDIAAAANVTKRTLYRYVGSKEQLLYEIHESFLGGLLQDVASSDGKPEDRFRAMVQAHMCDLAANVRDIKVFFEEIKHLGPAKRGELFGRRADYERAVSGIIADGVDKGAFQASDVPLATRVILGAMNEGYRWYRGEEPGHGDSTADLIAGQFLFGLEARAPGRGRVEADAHLARSLAPAELTGEPDQPLDRILTAATKLFRAHGYHRTNTQQIAECAGMTKGALFYHVGYKEEALVKIQERLYDRTSAVLRSLEDDSARAGVVLARLVAAQTVLTARYQDAVAVVSEEMKYLPPEAAPKLAARQAEHLDIFERTIRRGAEDGDLVAEDARIASRVVQGMINSTYRWYRPDEQLSPTDLGLAFVDIILHGLSTRSPSRR
ncbi:TetR family transcriptional regulator [Streptomyces sp. E5N91]|uniref:TetR family transcriptional regulator n=1 Tax=Streptomyces sp. E5N91 TaxID=1851996 RepID=UPI00187D1CBC|nr:TetR family transcriptional regulator [Streptomyces sp. E5N91]